MLNLLRFTAGPAAYLFLLAPIPTGAQPPHPATAAQAAATGQTAATGQAGSGGQTAAASDNPSWLVRDPLTGRIFQQQMVSVAVPVTHWEVKPMTTTVYQPTTVVKSVPVQQTTFTPSTQYVMQPKLRGWWNPLKQPVQAYEFVPVTSWQPQTQTVQNQVAAVEWVPQQQVVYVPQAVQKVQTHQQIVSKEIPQPPTGLYPPASQSMLAAQPRPLVTIPILAQQRVLPWPSAGARGSYASAGTTTMRNVVNSGLRPIANAVAPTYAAPLRTASSTATSVTRDSFQTGMSATVLR